MRHKDDCKCVNCEAKGKPIREIWLIDVTVEDLSNIEIFDWLEGYGQIMSLSSQKLVRKYGFLLVKKQNEIRALEKERDKLKYELEAEKLEKQDWFPVRENG